MEKLIAFCRRWAWPIVIVWIVLSGVSVFGAAQLRLNSDLARLLPASARSVMNLDVLEQAYGQQLDRFTLLIEGDDPKANLATVDALSEMLSAQDHVISVESRRPTAHFQQNRLLYMDLEDVETISQKISKRVRWEKRQANPLFVSIGKKTPPEVDFSEIEKKYTERLGTQDYLANDALTKFVITVELDFPSDSMDRTAEFRAHIFPKIQHIAQQERVEVTATGRYNKRVEQRDATARDLGRGTSVAFVLIFAFLLFYFRSFKPPVIVSLPLIAATLCTFGATYLVFQTLNILTGFVGSVLLGLGIDYGIHLAARYRIERSRHTAQQALVIAYESSGKASLYAGITTVTALGSLALSSFQAFHEFGLLSLIGMSFVGLAYSTLFPTMVLLLDGTKFALSASHDQDHESRRWRKEEVPRLKSAALAMVFLMAPLGLWGLTKLDFEFDFHKLMPEGLPSIEADYRIANFIETGRVPQVVLVDDRAHASAVVEELKKRKTSAREGQLIDRTLTIFDLLPEQQAEKAALLKELDDEFKKLDEDLLAEREDLLTFSEEVDRVVKAGTITRATLPGNLARRFARRDDPEKAVVLVFPSRIIHDARDAITYSTLTESLPGPGGQGSVDAIGEEPIMRDIVNDLRGDTIWMLGVTVLGILLVSLVAFRDPRRIALVCVTIVLGCLVAAGLIGAVGVKFNFINLIILPIWLGLGVDAAFHMMTRLEEAPHDAGGFWHTVGAVLAAFGTTMIGFGGLMISSHRGLGSLGKVAVIGLAVIFLLSVAIQLIALRSRDALGDDAPGVDE